MEEVGVGEVSLKHKPRVYDENSLFPLPLKLDRVTFSCFFYVILYLKMKKSQRTSIVYKIVFHQEFM
jgi:hypothetical protein